MKWANLWLGGGKNLHHEEVKKRPSSAHVPGWKEEWKEDMKDAYRPHTTNSATRYSYVSLIIMCLIFFSSIFFCSVTTLLYQ